MFAASTVLKIHGEDPAENLFQLGLGRFLHGDYQQAATHFTAALKHDPANPSLYCRRGETFRLLCDYERAIADFTSALRLEPPDSADILVNRAVVYLRNGDPQRAVADASAALEIDSENAAALRTRAAAHAELGSPDLALADLTRALALAPQDDEVFYHRGLIHAKKEDFSQAISDFDRAIAANPFRVSAYFERANAHFSLKDYFRAVADYTEVLRHQPNHVLAYGSRALCHKRRGDRDRAIADYTEALRLDVANAQNYYQRGMLYRAKGDFVRAEADLDEAIRLQPENWAAGYHRAKVFLAQDRITQTIEDLDCVLRLNPKLVVGYLSRALAKDRIGRYRDAIADSTHALKLDDDLAACHLVRGVIHIHKEEYAAAIGDLTRALERDERFPPAYFQRGLAYAVSGDYDSALADCDRFVALDSANAQGYVLRSVVYQFKGQVEPALADYARVLEIDPRCVLIGFNHGLADTARAQTTKLLADYVDGLVAVTVRLPSAESSSQTKASVPAISKETEETIEEFEIVEILNDSTVPQTQAAPLSPVIRGEGPGVRGSGQATTQSSHPNPSPLISGEKGIEAVTCPLCNHVAPPAETLEGGRVRCGKCTALFVGIAPEGSRPAARQTAPTRKPIKKAEKSQAVDEEPSFIQKWKKPIPLAAASLLVLAAVFWFYPKDSFGNSNRLAVVPVQGAVDFDGKAIPGAVIFLHPFGVKDVNHPTPRGTVQADGAFVLGTYAENDGAPVGEYRASVQWFAKVENPEINDSVMPRNQLPPKYARAETAGLIVKIQEGDNKIPAIHLKR